MSATSKSMLDKAGAEKLFKRIEEALQTALGAEEDLNDCMWYIYIQVQKLREIVLGKAGEKWQGGNIGLANFLGVADDA